MEKLYWFVYIGIVKVNKERLFCLREIIFSSTND